MDGRWLQNMPSYLDGGTYIHPKAHPGGTNYMLTVHYNAPATIYVLAEVGAYSADAEMSLGTAGSGWDLEVSGSFKRYESSNLLRVYSIYLESGSSIDVGPFNGGLVGGVVATCEEPPSTSQCLPLLSVSVGDVGWN